MIRIAHILPFMGVGGTEQMILNLCKFRNQEEFEYLVAAPKEGVIADEIRRSRTPVYTGQGAYDKAIVWADLLNLHWTDYNSGLHNLVQSSGKPYVTTLHCAVRLPKLPAVTICTSDYAYQIQENKNRFVYIPNGVDLSQFAPRPRIRREEVIITRVCRPIKCATYFWESMKKVLDKYPQTRLWIVGNDSNRGQSSERVRFLGIRRDIPEILAKTDIFAYTPYPNMGSKDLVVMEALAMGVPCVVSDVIAVRESIENEKNGFLLPYGDVDAFARVVGRLVEDIDLRISMGQNAIRIAQERFDMRRITGFYETLYQSVLDAHLSSWFLNNL